MGVTVIISKLSLEHARIGWHDGKGYADIWTIIIEFLYSDIMLSEDNIVNSVLEIKWAKLCS